MENFLLWCLNCYDRARHKLGLAHFWHITNAYSEASFPFFGSYRQAVEELRDRFPGANIVHIDRDWKVIFYKVPAK